MLLPTIAEAAAPTARMGVSGSAVADASRSTFCSGARSGARAGL